MLGKGGNGIRTGARPEPLRGRQSLCWLPARRESSCRGAYPAQAPRVPSRQKKGRAGRRLEPRARRGKIVVVAPLVGDAPSLVVQFAVVVVEGRLAVLSSPRIGRTGLR